MVPQRTPWPLGFPDVHIIAAESPVKQHAHYRAAKTGDAQAAARLVQALVPDSALQGIRQALNGASPIIASIHAVESEGINSIPEALADRIAQVLGLHTDDAMVQVNVVNHTGADGFSRLARQALFDGEVRSGADYLIVDDFIGQGGTMANFRGHIETRGARVIGAVALTGKAHSARLALTPEQLDSLRAKHGELEHWWRDRFGFGFDALTQSEARYLERTADADTVRNRIAAVEQAADR